MRAPVIVSLLLAGGASAALAHIGPSPLQEAPKAIVQAQTGGPGAAEKKGRAGHKPLPSGEESADKASAPTDSLASCLAMWERATHMSKQEWARACRRVDDRLRNISVK